MGRSQSIGEQARANEAANPWLRELLERYRPVATWWSKHVDRLLRMVPPPESRSWGYANSSGCPLHGGTRATYSYRLEAPGRVFCRVGREEYPNPEFPDPDGRGWLDRRAGSLTEGQRYQFTADAHRFLWIALRDACFSFALEYALHGRPSGARACASILEAIGSVYPRMDNRSCESWAPRGWHVPLSEHIMEGIYLRALACAYLLIAESGELGASQRTTIEDGLFRHAGNVMRRIHASHPSLQVHNTAAFLLHGIALCGRAIGDGELVSYAAGATDELFANGTWHDGFWNEGAVGYHAEVTRALCFLAEAVRPTRDLYSHGRLRGMIDFLFELRSYETGEVLALGDTLPASDYCSYFAPAARWEWDDERYVVTHGAFAATGSWLPDEGFPSTPALGEPDSVAWFLMRPLRAVEASFPLPSGPAHAGSSAGMSVLRAPATPGWLEAMLYYGSFFVGQTHGHSDKLSLALFGQGRAWLEEIGRTDGYLIPVYAGWCQNTLSHATVVVDSRRQEPNPGGRLNLSYLGDRVSLADASAEDAYPGRVSLYRRCVVLVRDPRGSAYILDLFRVRGGARHEYSVHASSSLFSVEGVALPPPREGSLEGPGVPYGDPRGFDMSAIMGYRGSGYQFLAAPRSAVPAAPWRALWRDGERGLSLCMPAGASEVVVAEGRRFHQQANDARDLFTYLLARRESPDGLASDFVATLEVYRGRPAVQWIRRIEVAGGGEGEVGCSVSRGDAEDFFLHSLEGEADAAVGPLSVRGSFACATIREEKAEMLCLVGGSHASAAGLELALGRPWEGAVTAVLPLSGEISVRWSSPPPPTLAGSKVLVERQDGGATDFEIARLHDDRLRVSGGNLELGRGVVSGYDTGRRAVATLSPLLKLATPGPHGRGAALLCEGWAAPMRFRIDSSFTSHGQPDAVFRLILSREPERAPEPGERFTVLCVCPGDTVRVPASGCLERIGEKRFRLSATTDATVSLGVPAGRVWALREGTWTACGDVTRALVPVGWCSPGCDLAVSEEAPG